MGDTRTSMLYSWVHKNTHCLEITAIPGDASARRYFRVCSVSGNYIAVDAPPTHEKNQAFVHIAQAFLKIGLNVPQILDVNFEDGFLLLSDLGDTQLLNILNNNNVHLHYNNAIEQIIKLQTCTDFGGWQLPLYDHTLLLEELSHFHNWYLSRHLGLVLSCNEVAMLQTTYDLLIHSALIQPQICVHRDYHSRNLMVLPNNEIGILDFQDAVKGPITYDLVSLLRDCYIKWPVAEVDMWTEQCWQLLQNQEAHDVSLETFVQWFDWMGLQRHLKVLGIFARLFRRDGKDGYLQHMPRIFEYIYYVCDRYHELTPLKKFLINRVIIDESNDFSSRPRQSNASTHR